MKVIISYRDKYIRKEIAGYLRDGYPNCEVLGFEDELLAAKEAYSEPSDVIVLGTEGIKLIPMLKKSGGGLRIVILADNDLHRYETYSMGGDAYVTRPYEKEDFFAAIEGTDDYFAEVADPVGSPGLSLYG